VAGVDDKLLSTSGGLSLWENFSIHPQLKRRKVFHYTHCLWHDVAASEICIGAI
jgi:hypothetical protein